MRVHGGAVKWTHLHSLGPPVGLGVGAEQLGGGARRLPRLLPLVVDVFLDHGPRDFLWLANQWGRWQVGWGEEGTAVIAGRATALPRAATAVARLGPCRPNATTSQNARTAGAARTASGLSPPCASAFFCQGKVRAALAAAAAAASCCACCAAMASMAASAADWPPAAAAAPAASGAGS